MNFKEEYIKAVEEITPDRQTIDRMKANVLNMTRTKRAFPFKTVAAVGGTVAACAVITFAAVRIVPNIASDSKMIDSVNAMTYHSTGGMNGAAEDKAAEFTVEFAVEDACVSSSYDEWDEAVSFENNDVSDAPNAANEPVAPAAAQSADTDGSSAAATWAIPSPEATRADEPEAADSPVGNSAVSPDVSAKDNGIGDFETTDLENEWYDATGETCEWYGLTEEIFEPNEIPEDTCAETLEPDIPATGEPVPFIGYTLTISEDLSECTLSGNGERLTFKRSSQTDTSSFANDKSIPYIPLTNTTDNKTYYVALAEDIVIIKDENYRIIALFE